uniref:Uncharacterized protein n=1 Tax=Anguilla anguilla TaxID=7936 RepID=A0A0E9XCG3_ANGAN
MHCIVQCFWCGGQHFTYSYSIIL